MERGHKRDIHRKKRDAFCVIKMEKKEIKVFLCTKEEFDTILEERDINPWYGRRMLRGFCYPSTGKIYIIKDCLGELALLAHEYGHIRGKKHCIFPSIMNFSGLFRWFAFHPLEIIFRRWKQ